MDLQKINWWKMNAFWILYGGIIFWSKNLTHINESSILASVLITSFFGLLFFIGFWKHSKVVFWFSIVSFLFSIMEMVISPDRDYFSNTETVLNFIVSIILISGLTWQVIVKKN